MTRFVAICALFALGGCAENAVLEVELTLPPQPVTGDPLFAYVQVRSSDVVSFAEEWAGTEAIDGRALVMDEPSTLPFSVVAGGASITRQLGVRVRFCSTPNCSDVGDDRAPTVQWRIERAFYQGQRTRLSLEIVDVPDPPTAAGAPVEEIDKCHVEGCAPDGMPTNFCYMNLHHFCEE